MNCQEIQEQLLAHRVGELDDAAAAVLHQHLETCAACRAAAEEQERVLDLMRSAFAAGPVAPAQLDQRHRNRVLRAQFSWRHYRMVVFQVAAALLMAFVLGEALLPKKDSARHAAAITARLGGSDSALRLADASRPRAAALNPAPVVEALKTAESVRQEAAAQPADATSNGRMGAVQLRGDMLRANDARKLAAIDVITPATRAAAKKAPTPQSYGGAASDIVKASAAQAAPKILDHGTPEEIKAEAIRTAQQDIIAGKMRICIAGTRGADTVGVPPEKQALVQNLPRWNVPCGCTEPLAQAGSVYAEAYNHMILNWLEKK